MSLLAQLQVMRVVCSSEKNAKCIFLDLLAKGSNYLKECKHSQSDGQKLH